MAKGFKSGGRDFQKGNQVNKGRVRVVREAKHLNRALFENIANKYLDSNLEQLKEIIKNPETASLDVIVIRVIILAIEKGDPLRLNFFLDRLLGKVTEKIDHISSDGSMSQKTSVNLDALTTEQLEVLKKAMSEQK